MKNKEILTGLRGLDSVSGTNHFAQLMEKLSPGSSDLMPGDQNILIDLSSWHKDSLTSQVEEIRREILMKGAAPIKNPLDFSTEWPIPLR